MQLHDMVKDQNQVCF